MAVVAALRGSKPNTIGGLSMEFFFIVVGLMVILALIRVWQRPNASKKHTIGSNEPVHFWMGPDVGGSHGEGGWDGGSTDSGGDSFDGGGSDGGGGDSSGF